MKTEEWSVYKHTSPSGKVYIGITHQKPEYRWRKGLGYKYNYHFWRAIKKYGWENFKHEIIANGLTKQEAELMECSLVKEYKSSDKRFGYNIADGGHVLSEESRKKIGETRKARNIPSPTKGKHLSEETRAKISKAHRELNYRKPMSDEGRENIRKAKLGSNNPNYGKPMNPNTRKSLMLANKKPVYQIIGDKEILWDSPADVEKTLGIAQCNISRVCNGQRQTAGGFKWKYA